MLSATYQQQKMAKSSPITAPNMSEEFKEMIEAKISPAAAPKDGRGCWQEIGDLIISNI